ncbi:MAG: radical SAM protein [Mariprofundus sp.]
MPCTLIRLAGCPLRCAYCDTPQAIPTDSGNWIAIEDIVAQVRKSARPLILVTGGEPLAQRHSMELLQRLLELDCILQLETSGAYSVKDVPSGIRRIIDIKTPGSGEVQRNCFQNLDILTAGDELKLVLTGRDDYEWARDCIHDRHLELNDVPVLLSPAWGEISARDLCAWVLEDKLPVRIQVQMHKTIWGAEAEGV